MARKWAAAGNTVVLAGTILGALILLGQAVHFQAQNRIVVERMPPDRWEIPGVAAVELHWAELQQERDGWRVEGVSSIEGRVPALQTGDLITRVGGHDAAEVGPLSIASLLTKAATTPIDVTVRRGTANASLSLLLGERDLSPLTHWREQYGVGIQIYRQGAEGPPVIAGVYPGTPAALAGIKEGDRVVAINGQTVTQLPISTIVGLIRSPKADSLRLQILRGTQTLEVTLSRVPMLQFAQEPEWTSAKFPVQGNGAMAPPLQLTSLQGQPISLEQFRGKWVVVNFWATWCGPCVHEIPDLSKLADDYRGRLVVLGVAVDEHPEAVPPLVAQLHPSYEVAFSPKNAARVDYNVEGVPENILIDPNGYVRYVELGGDTFAERVRAILLQ